ncbi:MAG: D-alanine--D-alanine ligase [Gammaproteobacteria bacterium]|nr:D-alanine--D-alanine ligase [Gammaproteobacteria bacterium]
MRRHRVLIVLPESGVAPEDAADASDKDFEKFKAVYDVMTALEDLGHEHRQLGLSDDAAPLRSAIAEWKPTIVFNLLDDFRGYTFYDQHLTSFLQLMRIPFTGCNPRGLVLASDKVLAKKVVLYHRIRTPRFQVFPRFRKVHRASKLRFPLIVKVHLEEASSGIAQTSVVHDDEQLAERVRFVHESFETAALVEEYIDGRELNVSVIGNQRLQVLPVWELFMDKLPAGVPRVATHTVKWNLDYQEKYQIRLGPARRLPADVEERIVGITRRIYRALLLSGYARIDYRLSPEGRLYFLEANANPDISRDEELASAAKSVGISYEDLIRKIINLGLRWSKTF